MTPNIGIVGAGILGVMTAFQMRKAMPDAKLTLYDRSLRGAGASQWSAGVHFPYGRSPVVRDMTRMSENFYKTAAHFAGSKMIQSLRMQMPVLNAEMQKNFTHPVIDAQIDPLLAKVTRGGINPIGVGVTGAQYADVHGLVQETAAGLSASVNIREGIAVQSIRERGRQAQVTLSDGTQATHDVLILAPGPWSVSPEVSEWLQHLGLKIKRVVALHLAEPDLTPQTPLAFFPEQDAFLLPRVARHEWLFSYTNMTWEDDPEKVGPTLDRSDLEAGQLVLEEIAPSLVPRCQSGRVFCDTYTPERTPLVVPVGAQGRIIYAGGANGSGYRLAPAMASAALNLTSEVLGMEMV
mmetsp:Transcript_18551/g.30564  ORF Transcript_18551/g.30564 Transcript_18551/m.30564 type:complete len:351 (+) Transcript_18551:1443-2495(+)